MWSVCHILIGNQRLLELKITLNHQAKKRSQDAHAGFVLGPMRFRSLKNLLGNAQPFLRVAQPSRLASSVSAMQTLETHAWSNCMPPPTFPASRRDPEVTDHEAEIVFPKWMRIPVLITRLFIGDAL